MSMSRKALAERLEALDVRIPELVAEYPDPTEFWNAFAGEADFATEGAGAADYDWINSQVDALLQKHGIPVPEDEPPVDG